MSENVRVRFAPSPTGPLHIGGVRTALYNYLFARKHEGTFILRMEDTDQARYVPGAEDYIKKSLRWCGLQWDEGVDAEGEYGPYRQSERKDSYRQFAEQMVRDGYAYYAWDTPEELEAMRQRLTEEGVPKPQYNASIRLTMKNSLAMNDNAATELYNSDTPRVIRIKVPENETVIVHDNIRGEVRVDSSEVDDKVLLKADGMPTYHLANVVDDYHMKISHVIRGEEWLPSTPVHVLLYRFLGWEEMMPEFAHLPLLLKPDGNGKLSKRDGDRLGFPVFPLQWTPPETEEIWPGFKEIGFFPDAFINMLAFLGWNPGTEQEIFSMDELIAAFSIDRVNKAGARFNYEKATWYNEQYLKETSDNILAQMVKPIMQEQGISFSDDQIARICGLMKERATFAKDIVANGAYFFEGPAVYDEKTVRKKWKDDSANIVEALMHLFTAVEPFEAGKLEEIFKKYIEENEMGFGTGMVPLRLSLTGGTGGPPLFDIMEIIGKEESMNRLKTGMEQIPQVAKELTA